MLDIAWPELIVIGAVALVAIGPKDLPKAMYLLGKWAGKARAFAHEMSRTLEQAAYEAEAAEKMKQAAPSSAPPASESAPAAAPPPAASPPGGSLHE